MTSTQPWHAAFPAPILTADVMPRQRAYMILSMRIASMLIVDVRRTDYEGGSIRGSINIPAQGFWWNRGILYELAYKAGIEWVVFTCGSSNGRGPRCAGWFLDHVRNTAKDMEMQVLVLEGGVKGWVRAGEQFTQFMDGFREDYWIQLFEQEERDREREREREREKERERESEMEREPARENDVHALTSPVDVHLDHDWGQDKKRRLVD